MVRAQPHKERGQRGYMLLLVPIVIIGICALGYRMIAHSRTSMRVASADLAYLNLQMCSQQCVALQANSIQKGLEESSPIVEGSSSCRCESGLQANPDCGIRNGNPVVSTKYGCYGYYTHSTEVSIDSKCQENQAGSANLDELVDYGEIPLFQFAVFYENLLEIYPGPDMIIDGRVHCNDTILLSPINRLDITDWVTTPKVVLTQMYGAAHATSVRFARMDGSGLSAESVNPTNPTPLPLHSVVSNWSDWQKRNRVAYQGYPNGCKEVPTLKLPIRKTDDNHSLIEWRSGNDDTKLRRQKFAWKANLIYKDGWVNNDLNPVSFASAPIRIPASPSGWKSPSGSPNRVTFFDQGTLMVDLLPIDMGLLQSRSPSDSIIYLYDRFPDASQGGRDAGGFLIYGGQHLLRPLTVVTNTRLYILGDYNTDSAYTLANGKKSPYPSALISDMTTQLSNDFLPDEHDYGANYGSSIIGRDPGAQCIMNSCIMTGMIQYRGSQRNQGGYHYLVRFMENWDKVIYAKSGSMVCIWSSHQSQSLYAIETYTPPVRHYTFSRMYDDMRNMPPGTPRVVAPDLVDWEMARD